MKAVSLKSWKSLLETNDTATLWQSLHSLVSLHPLVKSAQRNQHNAQHSISLLSLPDLTQDLYLLLLEKARFKHYVQREMTDAEIEREIFQVELTNMLIGHLRRRQPENYRMVRRISAVLDSDPRFRVIRQPEGHPVARYQQAVNVVYGLAKWSDDKLQKDSGTFEELIAFVPTRIRNRRRVGCKGDSHVIVTNSELGDLLVELFRAIDSPATLRVLRSLALTKLPVYDAVISSIDQNTEHDETSRRWEKLLISSHSACPEQINLRREQELLARAAAHDFLARLDRMARFDRERTQKLWQILWHYYFDPAEPSQLSIAAMLNMSDSSVSDYRRRMEQEMQRIFRPEFSPEQLGYFAEELSAQLKRRLHRATIPQRSKPKTPAEISNWQNFNYSLLSSREGLSLV